MILRFGLQVVIETPLPMLVRMMAEDDRRRARERHNAMLDRLHVGQSDMGTTTTWRGAGEQPKSDWETSNDSLMDYMKALDLSALGLPPEKPLTDREREFKRQAQLHREKLNRLKGLN